MIKWAGSFYMHCCIIKLKAALFIVACSLLSTQYTTCIATFLLIEQLASEHPESFSLVLSKKEIISSSKKNSSQLICLFLSASWHQKHAWLHPLSRQEPPPSSRKYGLLSVCSEQLWTLHEREQLALKTMMFLFNYTKPSFSCAAWFKLAQLWVNNNVKLLLHAC